MARIQKVNVVVGSSNLYSNMSLVYLFSESLKSNSLTFIKLLGSLNYLKMGYLILCFHY